MGGVDSRRPVDFFALGEDGARHLELAEFACEGKHAVDGFSLRHLVQAVAEGKEGVEGYEMLVFEHGANSAGQFLMHTLAIGGVLTRACKELDDLAWRAVGRAAGCDQEFSEGGAG